MKVPPAQEMATSKLPTVEVSDGSLVRRFRCGSQDAATQIYLRYARRLRALAQKRCRRSLARREDTEDIVQSVFRRFFRRVQQGRYDVPAGEDLWKLFLVITLNKIRSQDSFHFAAKRDARLTVGENYLAELSDAHQGQDAEAAFLQLVIEETLERLPILHRNIIELRLEGLEVAEIAGKVGRSKRTVERVLQELRKKLSLLLEGQ